MRSPLSKKLHSLPSSIRRIIQPRGHSCTDPRQIRCAATLSDPFYTPMLRPKSPRRGEMIEFLAQMPTDTKIFLRAVLGLAAILIVLRRLI